MTDPHRPSFFASAAEFRVWLNRHHRSARELWVGFYKKKSGRPSLTWPESVDEALCFGWIDGVRKSIDAHSYVIRFTPRKRDSTWSLVNIRRARALIASKRMQPAGLRAFEARDEKKSGVYSFEQRTQSALDAASERRFRRNAGAWRFYCSQPPGYRRITAFWIASAKQEATRLRRLETVIAESGAGRRISMLQPYKRGL